MYNLFLAFFNLDMPGGSHITRSGCVVYKGSKPGRCYFNWHFSTVGERGLEAYRGLLNELIEEMKAERG
jgi:hypothetical protein